MKIQSKFVASSKLKNAWLEFNRPSLIEISEVFVLTEDKHERTKKYKANLLDILQCLKVVAAALSGGRINNEQIIPASQWVRRSSKEGFSITELLILTHNDITKNEINLTSLSRLMALSIVGLDTLGEPGIKIPEYVTEQLLNSYWISPGFDSEFKGMVELHLLALVRAATQIKSV